MNPKTKTNTHALGKTCQKTTWIYVDIYFFLFLISITFTRVSLSILYIQVYFLQKEIPKPEVINVLDDSVMNYYA